MSSTELSANVVYEVRQSPTNPNNIDVIVKSFTTNDRLAQLISGTDENANDDLKLRVFCKALREVINIVNDCQSFDAYPNNDGFTIQRKAPKDATDVMMLAFDSGRIHIWLQQYTKSAVGIIMFLAPTHAIMPVDISMDIEFDHSIQQEIDICALSDDAICTHKSALQYLRHGLAVMIIGGVACLIANFVYGPSWQATIALLAISGFAYWLYCRPYLDLIKQAKSTLGRYKHRLKKLCQQHPDWNIADAR